MNKRLFIAFDIPEPVRTNISTYRAESAFRWEDPIYYHITLRFLGDVLVEKIASIIEVINSFREHAPFDAVFNSFGSFNRQNIPSIVFAKVTSTSECSNLVRQLDYKLTELGLVFDRKSIHFHVTMCRLKNIAFTPPQIESLLNITFEPVHFKLDTITLYESVLGKAFKKYVPLYSLKLEIK